MTIHLFRSSDCDPEILTDVCNLLSSFPGPLRFIQNNETCSIQNFSKNPEEPKEQQNFPIEDSVVNFCSYNFNERFFERKSISWDIIFQTCQELRRRHDIGKEEFVVLLTSYNNDLNWFSAGNPSGDRDHFVHTEDWDFFVGSDRRFPIAYQIASGVLKKFVFRSYADLQEYWHEDPRGCMLDFCRDKTQVTLKVRTGDICPDCLHLFEEREAPSPIIEQVFRIFDGIRWQMLFKSRFRISRQLPVLHIEGRNKNLVFPDLARLDVHLNPLEKTVYLFFLNHPEGVLMSHLPDYKKEIRALYESVCPADDPAKIDLRVDELVNPRGNSTSEKISRIKRKLTEALGEEIAPDFIISGANGKPKKIALDRSLLVYAE